MTDEGLQRIQIGPGQRAVLAAVEDALTAVDARKAGQMPIQGPALPRSRKTAQAVLRRSDARRFAGLAFTSNMKD